MKIKLYCLLAAIILSNSYSLFSQGGAVGNIRTGASFLGYSSGASGPLDVRNDLANQNINFFAGGVGAAFQRMTILGANGNVGVGTTNPIAKFEVSGGNINVINFASVPPHKVGYMIGGNFVLWHNGTQSDIFVGVGAGNITMTGHFNTFVGNAAGTTNSSGQHNTATGWQALRFNTNGSDNTGVGFRALINNSGTGGNTAVGSQALDGNLVGGANVAVGAFALLRNTTDRNTAVGADAMRFSVTAFENTAVGESALRNNVDGIQNVAVGFESLKRTIGNQGTGQGEENTAVGNQTLSNNQLGKRNSAFGDDVLFNSQGDANTALGSEAMGANLNGNENTAVGQQTISSNVNGNRNSALGVQALFFNKNGDRNTVSGYHAGFGVTNNSHSRNCFYGYESGLGITIGWNNMFAGYQSGITNSIGSRNTIIGHRADLLSNNLNNATAIGSEAIVTANDKMILGNDTVKVGIGLSNDVTQFGPQNKLEIDFGINGHSPSNGGNGASGLRFRDLHALNGGFAANTPVPNPFNPNPAVLSVDQFGNVILVPDATGAPGTVVGAHNGTSMSTINPAFVSFGNDFNAIIGQLLSNREVPMNNFGILFSDPIVGVPGLNLPLSPNTFSFGRLNTYQTVANPKMYTHTDKERFSGMFVTNATTFPVGYGGTVLFTQPGTTTSPNYSLTGPTGAGGYVYGGTFDQKTGVYGLADAYTTGATPFATIIRGVFGDVLGSPTIDTRNIGVHGRSQLGSAGRNIGGYFEAAGGLTNYGIMAAAGGANIGGPDFAGYFNGDVIASGNYYFSDSLLKTNIENITNPIATIKQLKPKSFYFDTTNTHSLNFSGKKQYGFIAQHVTQVLPELVTTVINPSDTAHPNFSFCSLNYNAFIGLLTAGMQQQQLSIDSLRNDTIGRLGNICGGTQRPLTNNYEIPLNGNNLNFTAPANSLSKVFIGSPLCTNTQKARFTVTSDAFVGAASFINMFNSVNPTRAVTVANTNNNGDAIGIVIGSTSNTGNATGILCSVAGSGGGSNIAIQGTASGSTTNYGLFAAASSGTTNYAGYFNGDVVRTGSDNFTSDQNLKQNIDTIGNALNTIMQLQPKTFTYKQSSYPSMNLPSGKQYGLIAQDVLPILPELINTTVHPAIKDSAGNVITPAVNYLSLEYQQLTAIMIKAMQQQQAQIDSLKSVLSSCCNNNSKTTQSGNTKPTNTVDVELSDADVVVLNQNNPNPFAEQTTISYNIPKNATASQILFYDINGRQIKSVDIMKKGKGQLNVYANDLTNGIYSYTLIVDGKIIDTKKMVKQQ